MKPLPRQIMFILTYFVACLQHLIHHRYFLSRSHASNNNKSSSLIKVLDRILSYYSSERQVDCRNGDERNEYIRCDPDERDLPVPASDKRVLRCRYEDLSVTNFRRLQTDPAYFRHHTRDRLCHLEQFGGRFLQHED